MNLGIAISVTASAFKDKVDKGGAPYILHCLRVMNAVKHLGKSAMCMAVMHDIVEDIEHTLDSLSHLGFSHEIVSGINHLTHREGEEYDDYIKRCGLHPIAKEIKKADLRDNSDITRLKGIRKKDIDRMEKYHRSYLYLS